MQDFVREQLQRAAAAAAQSMRSVGLTPPAENVLVLSVIVTSVGMLVGLVFTMSSFLSSSRSSRDSVLIIGASPPATVSAGPGKTTLLHVLRTGHPPPMGTVPSQIANDGSFVLCSSACSSGTRACARSIRWIDFPGHARLRPRLAHYMSAARGVIFVVDCSPLTFSRTIREAADLLHDVLKHPTLSRDATPVLVFCNKADVPGAIAPADVKRRMEAELERTRKAKVAGLGSARNAMVMDNAAESSAYLRQDVLLGYENEEFSFEHLPNDVQFVSGSAKNCDVSSIVTFVSDIF